MPFQNELIIVLIASVMLAMGLSIRPSNLIGAVKSRVFVYSLLINILILPAAAAMLYSALDAVVANTLLLAALCGVGTTAPLFTDNVRGHIAVATLAVVVTGFTCLLMLPLALWWFGLGSADVATQALWLMLSWQVIPLLLGFVIARLQPSFALRLASVLKWVGNISLITLIIGLGVVKGPEFFALPLGHLLVLAVFVAATFCLPALLQINPGEKSALVFTTSTRNLNLGLLIVVDALKDDQLLTYVLVYCAIMYLIWPIATWIFRRQGA